MEFKYLIKSSVYAVIAIAVFVLAMGLSDLIYNEFGVLIEFDFVVILFFVIIAIGILILGHLDWHEEADKKA